MAIQQNLFKLEDKRDFKKYAQSTQAPFYEIQGENPDVYDLYDIKKYNTLIEDIDKVECEKIVKDFLKCAATRFIAFRFDKIAEFYAHQNKEVQEIMRRLALVIVDYHDALREGFATLDKDFQEHVGGSCECK